MVYAWGLSGNIFSNERWRRLVVERCLDSLSIVSLLTDPGYLLPLDLRLGTKSEHVSYFDQ